MTSDREIPDVDPDDELPAPTVLLAIPAVASAILRCPLCDQTVTITAKLTTRAVRDSDGRGSLALRTRAPKVDHACDQISLGLVEGSRSR